VEGHLALCFKVDLPFDPAPSPSCLPLHSTARRGDLFPFVSPDLRFSFSPLLSHNGCWIGKDSGDCRGEPASTSCE
jgi:hypothetical protein